MSLLALRQQGVRTAPSVRFVDPANGSNKNNGLSWVSPMATIQAAYDDLRPKLAWWQRAWNAVVGLASRWRLIVCVYCDNDPYGCDCGTFGVGGGHYAWCVVYNGCPLCGRNA